MRTWKRLLALALTVGAVLAVAVALVLTRVFATQDIIDVAALALLVAALIGLYVLRRHAREVLVYDRGAATSGSGSRGNEPDEPPDVPTPFGELTRRVWW
jgi:hypothetical protein